MDTLSVLVYAQSNIVNASVHWSMMWIFIGFVSAVVFWYPIVRQFTNGR